MALTITILQEVNEALDQLRDATFNRDITRADKIKRILIDYLKPEGYTIIEDPKELYVMKAIDGG